MEQLINSPPNKSPKKGSQNGFGKNNKHLSKKKLSKKKVTTDEIYNMVCTSRDGVLISAREVSLKCPPYVRISHPTEPAKIDYCTKSTEEQRGIINIDMMAVKFASQGSNMSVNLPP